jgi:hypothetical protein
MSRHPEINIEITPLLMQFAREDGHELGIGLSRVRTDHNESWKEWFLVKTGIDQVIETFITHDPALHHDGETRGLDGTFVQRIRNSDPRLTIDIKHFKNSYTGVEGTGVTVYYQPLRSSIER